MFGTFSKHLKQIQVVSKLGFCNQICCPWKAQFRRLHVRSFMCKMGEPNRNQTFFYDRQRSNQLAMSCSAETVLDSQGFHKLFFEALDVEQLSKSAGASDIISSDTLQKVSRALPEDTLDENPVEQGDKNKALSSWAVDKLYAFTKFRCIALSVAPLEILHDSEALTHEGLLGPQSINIKDECTKRDKVVGKDGKKLKQPRFRNLKVQTFEDGLLARIWTLRQCEAEKNTFASPWSLSGSPVLVGSGHLGVARLNYTGPKISFLDNAGVP